MNRVHYDDNSTSMWPIHAIVRTVVIEVGVAVFATKPTFLHEVGIQPIVTSVLIILSREIQVLCLQS